MKSICVALVVGGALAIAPNAGTANAADVRVGTSQTVPTASPASPASGQAEARVKAQPRITLKRGKVSIRGTRAADRIKVTVRRGTLVIKAGGTRQTISLKQKDSKKRAVQRLSITGRAGDDHIKLRVKSGTFPRTSIQAGRGDDIVRGGNGVTRIDGRDGNDTLIAGSGRTTLTGSDGDDTLIAGEGTTTASGQSGNDVFEGGTGPNTMVGGDGNDVMTGGTGPSNMFGANGTDTITGGSGASVVDGGNDDDVLAAGTGAATLQGEAGNDRLTGGPGVDTLYGGGGNDLLTQSPGADQLAGGEGADTYALDADVPGGPLTLTERPGDGFDTVSLAATTTVPVAFDLGSTAVQPLSSTLSVRLNAAAVFENLVGGALDDTLAGNQLNNVLTGGPGADVFAERGTDDVGNDTVTDRGVGGADKVDLDPTVGPSGLGTTRVTLTNLTTGDVLGMLTSTNGSTWQPGDFA